MCPDAVSLAHKRMDTFWDVYGECRDSERTQRGREPVGMAIAARLSLSHARTKMGPDGVSLAHKRMDTFWDVYGECRDSEQTRSVCEPVGMANCGKA